MSTRRGNEPDDYRQRIASRYRPSNPSVEGQHREALGALALPSTSSPAGGMNGTPG
jgi:hypothetical protein